MSLEEQVWPDKYGITRIVMKAGVPNPYFQGTLVFKESFYHITTTLSFREMKHKSYSHNHSVPSDTF